MSGAYCARAQGRASRGKVDGALKDIAKALELDPHCAEAYALRADIHRDRMDFADAVNDYKKAIEIDPARKPALQAQLDKIQAMMK